MNTPTSQSPYMQQLSRRQCLSVWSGEWMRASGCISSVWDVCRVACSEARSPAVHHPCRSTSRKDCRGTCQGAVLELRCAAGGCRRGVGRDDSLQHRPHLRFHLDRRPGACQPVALPDPRQLDAISIPSECVMISHPSTWPRVPVQHPAFCSAAVSLLRPQVGSLLPAAFIESKQIELGLYPYSYSSGVAIALGTMFALGFMATRAEPALNVVGQTVEKLSKGSFTCNMLVYSVCFGVGIGMTVGATKILFGAPLVRSSLPTDAHSAFVARGLGRGLLVLPPPSRTWSWSDSAARF